MSMPNKDALRKELLQLFMDAKYDRERPRDLVERAIKIVYAEEDKKIRSLAKLILFINRRQP